ncbi:hypothetical protein EVAR_86521_1 [Eumeta japonica]|uniref:Uncharacterized protein n=1 Tax=Eumeta variegata TaxID=151549 RepID=A0A4C1VRD4_EUMVA|nr:hypothetical protein EVAR_86521_1 [Eumeta japonica]
MDTSADEMSQVSDAAGTEEKRRKWELAVRKNGIGSLTFASLSLGDRLHIVTPMTDYRKASVRNRGEVEFAQLSLIRKSDGYKYHLSFTIITDAPADDARTMSFI